MSNIKLTIKNKMIMEARRRIKEARTGLEISFYLDEIQHLLEKDELQIIAERYDKIKQKYDNLSLSYETTEQVNNIFIRKQLEFKEELQRVRDKEAIISKIKHLNLNDRQEYKKYVSLIEEMKNIDSFEYYILQGRRKYREHDNKQAFKFFKLAEGINPYDYKVLHNLYRTNFYLGNYEQAFIYLNKYQEYSKNKFNFAYPLTLLKEIIFINQGLDAYESNNYNIMKDKRLCRFDIPESLLDDYYASIDLHNNKEFHASKLKLKNVAEGLKPKKVKKSIADVKMLINLETTLERLYEEKKHPNTAMTKATKILMKNKNKFYNDED